MLELSIKNVSEEDTIEDYEEILSTLDTWEKSIYETSNY